MFAEICRRNVLALADAYGRAKGWSEATVSNRFYNNGVFFRRLRAGEQSISVEKFGYILGEFARVWPEGVPWPKLTPLLFDRESLDGSKPNQPLG